MADNKAKEWMGEEAAEANLPPTKKLTIARGEQAPVVLPDKNIIPHRGVYIATWVILGFCLGIPTLLLLWILTEYMLPSNTFVPYLLNLGMIFLIALTWLAMIPFILVAIILIIIERAENKNNTHLRNFLLTGGVAILLGMAIPPISKYMDGRHEERIRNEIYVTLQQLNKTDPNKNSYSTEDLRNTGTRIPIDQYKYSYLSYADDERSDLNYCFELENGDILFGQARDVSGDKNATKESISAFSAKHGGFFGVKSIESCRYAK